LPERVLNYNLLIKNNLIMGSFMIEERFENGRRPVVVFLETCTGINFPTGGNTGKNL
jgi:hypothetical protein